MEQALVEKQAKILAEKKEKKKAKEKKKDVIEKLNGADPSPLDSSSSSKRKLEEATESPKHKKQHLSDKDKTPVQPTQSAVHSLTAAVAAKVAEQMAASANRQKSAALQSLFVNGRGSRENFMNR